MTPLSNPGPQAWASPVSAFLVALFATFSAPGADLTLKVVDKNPPKDLEAAIAGTLQKKAIQLLDGDKPAYEFWFCTEVPLQSNPSTPAKSLDAVKQTTLLGAVALPAARRDYRDDELPAGIYTMRLGLQPQDGNHLGTAEFSYFAVLIPAKRDLKPDGIPDFKALVKTSSQETTTDHPMMLSLRPPASAGGEIPKLIEPAPEHKSVRVKVPAKSGDSKTELVFELVYEGKSHK